MNADLRDKPYISHEDVCDLNFIRASGAYVFRRHFRSGLRSHILEVLDPNDVEKETRGEIVDGVRRFPLARPKKMLRIFRSRFSAMDDAFNEIRKLRIVEKRLAPGHMAVSNEFIVDYFHSGGREMVLCGLQEFVEGEALDPWSPEIVEPSVASDESTDGEDGGRNARPHGAAAGAAPRFARSFINGLKKLVLKDRLLPDLAGARNILVTPSGAIKLVDINNISQLSTDAGITLDDRGYPVCDKSIEAMWLMERKLLGRIGRSMKKIYRIHLDPKRMRKVAEIDKRFHRAIQQGGATGCPAFPEDGACRTRRPR
ncbi:MAG: hypothetical protein GY859_31180 [Desulfobacterales bacterium]|nr:hypothetical protein [Desulfobacterales bacterium]